MSRSRKRPRGRDGAWYSASELTLNGIASSLIHQYDNNRYYNSTDGATAFPFTAVRTSNATMFDSQGRLVWAPANMIPQSSTAGAVLGVIGAGGAMPTGWTAGSAAGITREVVGITSDYVDVRLYGTNSSGAIVYPHIKLSAVQTAVLSQGYTLSATAAVIAGGYTGFNAAAGALTCQWLNAGAYVSEMSGSSRFTSPDLTRFSASGIAPAAGITQIQPQMNITVSIAGTVDITFRLSKPQLEYKGIDSPKPYNETTGTAYYGPRLDYDPYTLQPIGIQIEDQRTNLVPFSLNTSATIVTANFNTLASTKANSPSTYLGDWAACRFTSDATGGSHGAFAHTITPGASVKVSLQAIISPISGTTFYQLTGSGSWMVDLLGYVNFDCSGDGSITVLGASVEDTFIRRLATSVYHIGCVVTTSAVPSAGATCIVGALNTGLEARLPALINSNVFDFIYGSHFQASQGYSSIIPTFGVAATRTADVPTSITGSWLDTTKGTLYARFIRSYVPAASGLSTSFLQISDGTNNNRLGFISGSSTASQHRFDTTDGGVAQAQLQTSVSSASLSERKMAGSYALNDFKACENGGTVSTDVVGTIPVGLNRLDVGCSLTTNQVSGWISEIRYYADNSASGAQLQALTT